MKLILLTLTILLSCDISAETLYAKVSWEYPTEYENGVFLPRENIKGFELSYTIYDSNGVVYLSDDIRLPPDEIYVDLFLQGFVEGSAYEGRFKVRTQEKITLTNSEWSDEGIKTFIPGDRPKVPKILDLYIDCLLPCMKVQ